MKKILMAAAAMSLTVPVAVQAAPQSHAVSFGHYKNDDSTYYHGRKHNRRAENVGRNTRIWRDKRDGRYYCRRSDGTTGLIIGAAGGALLGRAVDTRGDRSLGTILGAAGGAILGREVERSNYKCR